MTPEANRAYQLANNDPLTRRARSTEYTHVHSKNRWFEPAVPWAVRKVEWLRKIAAEIETDGRALLNTAGGFTDVGPKPWAKDLRRLIKERLVAVSIDQVRIPRRGSARYLTITSHGQALLKKRAR